MTELNAHLQGIEDEEIRDVVLDFAKKHSIKDEASNDLIDLIEDIIDKDKEKYDEMFDRLNDEIDDSYEKESYDDFGKQIEKLNW